MNIQRVYTSGQCVQCGTCVGCCPSGAIAMHWDVRVGFRLTVDAAQCTDCGTCAAVCPGEGLDLAESAWWRERYRDTQCADFLGPWRTLWFGWASDETTRHAGASGGVATAILQGALAGGAIDAALVARGDPRNALAIEPVVARSAEEFASCRGSRYNVVATNVLLRRVLEEPGRYALVGLPCHIQGLRLAQERHPVLRERVVLALGVFCGWTNQPRATEVAARRAGLAPGDLVATSYRGPGWPGGLRLTARTGAPRELPFPDYFDRFWAAYTPPRCRLCPDALAELADISVGDAWLDRFRGSAGVSDVIVRTEAGGRLVAELAPEWLTLMEATADDVLASQAETYRVKRQVFRGRLWLRSLARRAAPRYPGVPCAPSTADKVAGVKDLAGEIVFRAVGDVRYR